MKLLLPILFCLARLHSFSQKLSIDEVIAMRQYTFEKTDSVLSLKGFVKTKDDNEPSFRIVVYGLNENQDSITRRYNYVIGHRVTYKMTNIQYVVWQKDDAVSITNRLAAIGYKKKVTKPATIGLRDVGGGSSPDIIEYQQGIFSIIYEEEQHANTLGNMQTTYVFKITTADFK